MQDWVDPHSGASAHTGAASPAVTQKPPVADVGVAAQAAVGVGRAGRAARAVHAHAAAAPQSGLALHDGLRPVVGAAEPAHAAIERAAVGVDACRRRGSSR